MQIVIRDDKPASAGTAMTPAGNATLRIITTSLMEDFFSDLTSARVVEAKGSATVLPDSGAFGQAVVINVVDLTVGQEPTANPTNVSCQHSSGFVSYILPDDSPPPLCLNDRLQESHLKSDI
jgi:hypothetical protein